jgi:hypothetical protein
MRRRRASGKRARKASPFWGTRSGRIVTGRRVTGIWGLVRQRRPSLGSKRKWETYWCPVMWERGQKCGIGSIRLYEAGRHTSAMVRGRWRIGRLTITSTKACGISCGGATRCNRVAPAASAMKWCSASWAYSDFGDSTWDLVRESTVKPVGKPDAGKPHVRFDERGRETGRRSASVLAPNLDSTKCCEVSVSVRDSKLALPVKFIQSPGGGRQ